MFERGRTDIVVVDMPEQHGIAVAVHGRKDKALLFPFERPRGDQHTPRLRVDDVDGIVFGPVTRQAGMQRGQRSVVGMLPAVIPLLRSGRINIGMRTILAGS